VKAEFIKSALLPKDYPVSSLPEVAFVGRSNVGKSSVINALLNRKNLVKVGKTPGKTWLINFFNINDKIVFVDLPGYGYAKVSKSEKKDWSENIFTYISKRENLHLIVLILDIRRVPTEDDIFVINMLNSFNRDVLILLNKSDKLSNNQITKQLNTISEALEVRKEDFVIFSAVKKRGVADAWKKIEEKLL
jgi:GTP-binding protein